MANRNKGKRYNEEQNLRILKVKRRKGLENPVIFRHTVGVPLQNFFHGFTFKELENGNSLAEICRDYGVAEGIVYCWRNKYGN